MHKAFLDYSSSKLEQLCSRIAVLNQGKMVFEGSLAQTRQREKWLRLKVNDFETATRELKQAQLITDQRDGQLVALTSNAGTDQVVKLLVQHNISVFEVAPAEETLENGTIVYRAKVEADRGRQKQELIFTNAKGRFVLATSEKLLAQTLEKAERDCNLHRCRSES